MDEKGGRRDRVVLRLNLEVLSAEFIVLADFLILLAEKAEAGRAEGLTRLSNRLMFLGDLLALLQAREGAGGREAAAGRA